MPCNSTNILGVSGLKHTIKKIIHSTYHRFHVHSSSPNYIEEDDKKEELDHESDVDYEILSKIIQ